MKILNILLFLNYILFCCSCGQHNSTPNSKCIEDNNKGTVSLIRYQQGSLNELTKAILFFKSAINCDSKYLMAYINLATAYDYKKDYQHELDIYNKILTFAKNDPTILTEKGIVFEKLKLNDSIKIAYSLAMRKFKDRLATHPDDINAIKGSLLLLALTEGKEAALKELNKSVASNPEISSKMASEYFFYQNFNKQAYIYHQSQ